MSEKALRWGGKAIDAPPEHMFSSPEMSVVSISVSIRFREEITRLSLLIYKRF